MNIKISEVKAQFNEVGNILKNGLRFVLEKISGRLSEINISHKKRIALLLVCSPVLGGCAGGVFGGEFHANWSGNTFFATNTPETQNPLTPTSVITLTPTETLTPIPTTVTWTRTPAPTVTNTSTSVPTPTPTALPVATATNTPINTPTRFILPTPTLAPANTLSPNQNRKYHVSVYSASSIIQEGDIHDAFEPPYCKTFRAYVLIGTFKSKVYDVSSAKWNSNPLVDPINGASYEIYLDHDPVLEGYINIAKQFLLPQGTLGMMQPLIEAKGEYYLGTMPDQLGQFYFVTKGGSSNLLRDQIGMQLDAHNVVEYGTQNTGMIACLAKVAGGFVRFYNFGPTSDLSTNTQGILPYDPGSISFIVSER